MASILSPVITGSTKIRARAPLRLGLAGGGTDVSPYSDDFGGAVLNATIDRFAFAFIEIGDTDAIQFVAKDIGIEETLAVDMEAIEKSRLKLHAAVYRRMITQFAKGKMIPMKLQTSVDAPPGSGLGSSSALVVAMVEAFACALDYPLGAYEIAQIAFEIERIELNLAGGKQDQYAAAFGGINFIEFLPNSRVIVNPLRVPRRVLRELEASLITCFSGVSRASETIIQAQQKGMKSKSEKTVASLHQLKADSVDMKVALLRGDIEDLAKILDRSWQAKQRTAQGVSTPEIDRLYDIAMLEGALAGKVSGAGGGGFIMFITPPEKRLAVIRALQAAGAHAEGVHLTRYGTESWVKTNKGL